MTPDALFQIANPLALLGWAALAVSPLAPRAALALAGWAIPLLLSLGYTALVAVHLAGAPGGFDTLAGVMTLFTQPWLVLAGWVHYLAFDLFTGAVITRTARAERIPHLLVLPCLALAFLVGPAGLLAFAALRATYGRPGPLPFPAPEVAR